MEWKPSASFGKLIGLLLVLATAGLTVISIWRVQSVDGTGRLLALGAAVTFAVATIGLVYLQHGLFTIRYMLGSDRLTIVWMSERRTIRFEDIRDVTFDARSPLSTPSFERFWPGYHVSTMQMRDGVWMSVATQEPVRRVRIATPSGIYAISPERPILFLAELARRRQGISPEVSPSPAPSYPGAPATPPGRFDRMVTAPTRDVSPNPPTRVPLPPVADLRDDRNVPARSAEAPQPAVRPGQRQARSATGQDWLFAYRHLFRERLLGDHVASSLIAVGVMIPLLMIAVLYSQYEGIPSVIPLHWNAHGDPDQFGTPRDLWRLPLIAVVVLVLNTALATVALTIDRFMARFLTAATPVVQILAFVALIRAVV